MKPARISC